jgi:hydrogenase-1 operon protein HyaE
MTPLESLMARPGVTLVDGANIDMFLAEPPEHSALVFSGETKRRPEAQDVAVVLRELDRAYRGTVRVGVLEGAAEDRLKGRFGVVVLPTVVLLVGGEVVARITRIQDWSVYADAFAAHFGPPPALAAE